MVCLEGNAKNRLGGYTGMQQTLMMLRNNQVVSSYRDALICPKQTYSSFPELTQ